MITSVYADTAVQSETFIISACLNVHIGAVSFGRGGVNRLLNGEKGKGVRPGVNSAQAPLQEIDPATSDTRNVPVSIVNESIFSEKVTEILADGEIPIAPSIGVTETTVGASYRAGVLGVTLYYLPNSRTWLQL